MLVGLGVGGRRRIRRTVPCPDRVIFCLTNIFQTMKKVIVNSWLTIVGHTGDKYNILIVILLVLLLLYSWKSMKYTLPLNI